MSGQIFISYRREESRWSARSLRDRLTQRFDRSQIFMDVDSVGLGEDFVKTIEKTVGSCDVLIAVIGAHWLSAVDPQGGRRLDNQEDFVRMEIAMALRRDVRVIPVLVDGALMPRSTDLPDDLKKLVRRNALQVGDTHFDDDCRRLVAAIEQVLEQAAAERREREKKRLEQEQEAQPPSPVAPDARSTPSAKPEADKPFVEIPEVIYPLAPKPADAEREPPPSSSGRTGGKSPSKQVIAFLAIAAVLVIGGLIYLAIRLSQSPQPAPVSASPSQAVIATPNPAPTSSSPVAVACPSPSTSLTQTVEEKATRSPETAATPPQLAQRPVQTPTEAIETRRVEGNGIDDYFGALPPQDFTKFAPSDLLQIIRSGGENILDRRNGYMFLKGDRAQVSLRIALFRDPNLRPLLAIAWGNLSGPDFTHLSFFTERDGRMVPADRTILPVGDADKLRFELPRIGLTLVVQDSSGKVRSKWTWNVARARFEFAK